MIDSRTSSSAVLFLGNAVVGEGIVHVFVSNTLVYVIEFRIEDAQCALLRNVEVAAALKDGEINASSMSLGGVTSH